VEITQRGQSQIYLQLPAAIRAQPRGNAEQLPQKLFWINRGIIVANFKRIRNDQITSDAAVVRIGG
jgi:hypothetical protein